MGYRVIARFFDKASGRYIDPGQECPPLPVEDAERLVQARCLVEEPDGGGGDTAPRRGRKRRAADEKDTDPASGE